ncbi:extracellular solute-binding protein (plasmid) [Ralstonia sp. 25C]|uniref:extracellular solute-binding protein n=1 Tax=Ralstonia sp. 25C TaxID=3447363 RepID=UPI003F750686
MKPFLLAATVASTLGVVSPVAAAADFDFWYGHSGPIAEAVESLCAGFNAAQHAHRVHCTSQGTYEQTMQKVVAAYRAGRQPAIVEIYDVGTLGMMLSGAIYPVYRLMRDTGHDVDWSDDLDVVRRYYADSAGHPDSLPFNVSTQILYVNKAWLTVAGIDHAPRTWEAFEAAAERLKAAGSVCPAVTDFDPWKLLEQTSAAQGEPIATQHNGRLGLDAHYVFNAGSHRRLMNDVMRWRARGLLIDAAATRAGVQTLAFATGECAMSVESTSAWSGIRASGRVDAEVGMVPIYAGTQRHNTVVGGASLWVMKGQSAAVYQGVAAFFDYLRQPAQQIAFCTRTGYLPATRRAANALMTMGGEHAAALAPIATGLASLSGAPAEGSEGARLGFMPQFRLAWQAEVQKAFGGSQTMNQALDRAKVRGDQLLQRFKDTYAGVTLP